MIKVGVVGASGYAGQNIIKLLMGHKSAGVKVLVSNTSAGEKDPTTGLTYIAFSSELLSQMDVVFLAVPHGVAQALCPQIKTKVIDMSVDHRLSHTYGLPEVFAEEIQRADLVGNPGCYATAAILSVYPIKDYIQSVVVDCISGFSGAGKNAREKFDYEENIIAYALTDHFHIQEIQKVLGVNSSFTPHVVPVFSGLMATAHIFLKEGAENLPFKKIYEDFYRHTYTQIKDAVPQTKEVKGSPYCHIGGFLKDANGRLVVVSVIDNLMKGAASQGIENMNLMFGLFHGEGLSV
jgi:N-acetyl-gamma-glutamyl-phosphate reductase